MLNLPIEQLHFPRVSTKVISDRSVQTFQGSLQLYITDCTKVYLYHADLTHRHPKVQIRLHRLEKLQLQEQISKIFYVSSSRKNENIQIYSRQYDDKKGVGDYPRIIQKTTRIYKVFREISNIFMNFCTLIKRKKQKNHRQSPPIPSLSILFFTIEKQKENILTKSNVSGSPI